MKRFKVLFGQRRFQVLATMAILLLAVSVVMASGANFTSTSANPGNVFTAGNLKHTNSRDGVSLVWANNSLMKPGDISTGSVGITNDGDVAGVFTLSTSNLADTINIPGGRALSEDLYLTVVEKDSGGVVLRTVYSNVRLNNVTPFTLGSFASGESRTYDFSVEFKDNGAPGGPNAGDNLYKRAQTSIQFDWEAVTS
jgi:hypothetical protein